ncbi:MAG: alpha/beta hydrolase-fold protein [Vicinamibacterales bacterium]
MRLALLAALVGIGLAAPQPAPQPAASTPAEDALADLVQGYLWPASDANVRVAEDALKADASLTDMTRERFHDLEEAMRRGRRSYPPAPPPAGGRFAVEMLSVKVPAGPDVPVLVQLPSRYDARTEWPLMFAMHGGPPETASQAQAGAERMLKVWATAADAAGWVVAAPALTPSVTAGARTEQRLPYEVFHPEQAKAVIAALRAHYRIDSDRMVSTGISLGSNYSIAFATSHPDWFSAIVPVSTEGDSRELLLRNLKTVPVYILEGTQDKNIRAISGPRALRDILSSFGYDLTYREFGDRAHEGFQEHYDDVLRWLGSRPRQVYPREVLRMPNAAITPLGRRVHWVEADTRQAFVHAAVISPSRIDITARWARTVKLYLHDRLVNLDQPIDISVNGVKSPIGKVPRSAATALANARARGDERLIDAAEVTVTVPTTSDAVAIARGAYEEMAPKHVEGTLSFWEMYATRALEERVPTLGIEGVEEALPAPVNAAAEQIAVRLKQVDPAGPLASAGLKSGDLLIELGGEPFFRDRGGVSGLRHWVIRELRSEPAPYAVVVWRDGRRVESVAPLKLGPYAEPKPTNGPDLEIVRWALAGSRVFWRAPLAWTATRTRSGTNPRESPHSGPTAPR